MKKIFFFLCIILFVSSLNASEYLLESPDKKIQVLITIKDDITYSLRFRGANIIEPSPVSMTLINKGTLGKQPRVIDHKRQRHEEIINPVIRLKDKTIQNQYNELILMFKNNYSIVFRTYNEGFAYRLKTSFPDEIKISSEEVCIHFTRDFYTYFPAEESFITHFERYYQHLKICEIGEQQMCSLPVLVKTSDDYNIVFTESDLEDYPGMFLHGHNNTSLSARFPAVPLTIQPGRNPDRDEIIEKRADYIAHTSGSRSFPWRVFILAEQDKDLIKNQLVYKLAKPLQLKDTSWINPGKVAWDWWNANNIYGVDFRAGINTQTYKYYIDFASQYDLEYVILDEGWSETTDLLQQSPGIDVQEICDYAESKKVGIILWVLWKPLQKQLKSALDQFQKWGVTGIKVDFMQRNDQEMVNYYHRIAREAAQRKMIVDFHGAFAPCGLRRAYPNVITREGLMGLEQSKWQDIQTPEHNLTLPFIRMVPGPMDYTPGAMINAQKNNFREIFTRPMSMGTRCHQLAMYVVYESPLQMLCDSPSNYLREKECMTFLSSVPTVWDTTIVIDAKISDYIILARKRGPDWYLGAMTDWSPREFEVSLSFLGDGEHLALMYKDGINADRYASDYHRYEKTVTHNDSLTIRLAPGGGWVAKISLK
ncbi:MAG: glycoside hydrolase family 97 protein [bacterium]